MTRSAVSVRFLNNELKALGYEMFGEQSDLELLDGKLSGHNDGTIRGIPEAPKTLHVLEIKTMNDKSFKDTVKKGVSKSKPGYLIQMQMYMEAMSLDRNIVRLSPEILTKAKAPIERMLKLS